MTPISGLITGGLGLNATEGMLTYNFHLFTVFIITGGGGPYPHPNAWNVIQPGKLAEFYKPVDTTSQTPPFYVPVATPKNHVIVRVVIGERTFEKEYLVPQQNTRIIVNVLNFINKTFIKGHVVISNIKRLTTNITVKIKNIIKRNPHKY